MTDDIASSGSQSQDLSITAARAAEQTRELRFELDAAEKAGRRFSTSLVSAFEGLAFKGKSVSDVVRTLAMNLSQSVLKSAFAPLERGIGALFSGALSGGQAFANGGVFKRGGVVPFASGGVISSPIAFPLSGGLTGLAGERGAEAIMPLARGRDGRLGVAAQGGASPSVTINISTPDAESFRKSETQVAAMIARASALGRRNL
jgi:phage-related minor tail protein